MDYTDGPKQSPFGTDRKYNCMRSDLQRFELSVRPLRLQLSALILQWHLQDVASSNHFLPRQGAHGALCDCSGKEDGEKGGLEDEGEGEGVMEGVGGGEGEMVAEVGGGGDGISREDGGEGVRRAWFLNGKDSERARGSERGREKDIVVNLTAQALTECKK